MEINKNKIGNVLIVTALMCFCLFLGSYLQKTTTNPKDVIKYVNLTEKQIDSIKKSIKPILVEVEVFKNEIKKKEDKREELKKQLEKIVIPDTCKEIVLNYEHQLKNCDSINLLNNKIIGNKDIVIGKQEDIINKQNNIISVLEVPKKPKPFGIGLQVGATTDLKEVKPYIGVGVSYNLIRF